jgi:putative heme iron utilization protein
MTPLSRRPSTRSAAEEARTLVASARSAALATLGEDGGPWCSLVLYAALEDGTPVLCLSTLAEHGRNLNRDPRASLMIAATAGGGSEDPLDRGRVTLAGRLEEPAGAESLLARDAYAAAASADYGAFGDFTYYALRIERVRWVGGYGRMATVDVAAYHAVRARGT